MTHDIPDTTSQIQAPAAGQAAEDADLLVRARGGDPAAHAVLYDRYAGRVMTLARRMLGSTSRAEDVLQDTFVDVIRGIGRFRDDADIGTWIHRIAINKCLSQLRSRWWVSRLDIDDTDSLPGPDGGQAIDAALELERLLDRLPDAARAVVWLHDAEGFTHAEIAVLMGRSESFSKSQLQRAHRRLRAGLDDPHIEEVERLCANAVKPV